MVSKPSNALDSLWYNFHSPLSVVLLYSVDQLFDQPNIRLNNYSQARRHWSGWSTLDNFWPNCKKVSRLPEL